MFPNEVVDGNLLCSKWLNKNEDIAYNRIINCTNVEDLKFIEKYMYTTICKWKNRIYKVYLEVEERGGGE
jgi:hypothetical protein